LEIVFEETEVELIWGDTLHDIMKVDLRLCLRFEDKVYDMANTEFKKNSKDTNLVLEDSVKVLVEAKAIFNKLAYLYNMNLEEAKQLNVITGQIVGLRCVLKQISLVAPGAYIAQSYGNTINHTQLATKRSKVSCHRVYNCYLYSRIR
jgi:hypothetical protein